MDIKEIITLQLKKGEYSFEEMPQMKVLNVKLPLVKVKEFIQDFDPTLDSGVTAVCKKITNQGDQFILNNVRISKRDSFGQPVDEKAIECTFYQMNNYI